MQSKYFEDFEVGDKFVTPGRTVTQADVTNFLGIMGAYVPIFCDEEFAKKTVFGTTVVPANLALAISWGQWLSLGFYNNTTMPFLGQDEWRMYAPVRVGNTLYTEVEVVEKRETSKLDRGIIITKHTTYNQENQKVMSFLWTHMYQRRSEAKQGGQGKEVS